jgi:DGQHR domain-containing protein
MTSGQLDFAPADDCESSGDVLSLPALEVRQGDGRILYSFAVDGKKLPLFAAVSRIHREEDAEVEGYQRPEILSHIASIRRYLESGSPMIPNALVVAFDKRVRFEPLLNAASAEYVRPGTLHIPVCADPADDGKPGWIVDGQQRSAAIRDARISSFPVCVTAFITDSDEEQRSQFILVNSAKPLPKGLIYELLPATVGALPATLQTRKFPAILLRRLNSEYRSPLYRRIRTPTTPEGIIKDNSVLKMLENSLSDGALYTFRDPQTGAGDEEQMMSLLIDFWSAVSTVFAAAWDKPPRQSRLMHGVGIASLGFLMDAVFDRYSRKRVPDTEDFARDLTEIADMCRWTNGYWDFGPNAQRRWNELQNTSRDIQLLTSYLLGEYKARVWSGELPVNETRSSSKAATSADETSLWPNA